MRSRLDKALAETGLVESRQRAQALVMAGSVRVNGVIERRPDRLVEDLFSQRGVKEEQLRELLGHTPVEVLAGGTLGVAVALLFPA